MRLSVAEYRYGLLAHFGASRLWMIPIGLAIAALAQILGVVAIFFVTAAIAFGDVPMDEALARISALGSRPAIFAFFATFLFPAAAVALWARLVHKIPFGQLLGRNNRLVLRDVFAGIAVILLVTGIGVLAALQYSLFIPNQTFAMWLPWVLPAMLLIFIQVFAEELVFRGYLQPILAARYSSPLVWLLIPAVLFGALHWQPSVFGSNAIIVVIAATLMGVVAGHVTARTGNISAAVGLHFANNAVGILFVAVQGDLSTLSLFVHPVHPSDEILMRGVLLGNIATIVGAYGVYLWFLRRRDARLKNPEEGLINTFE